MSGKTRQQQSDEQTRKADSKIAEEERHSPENEPAVDRGERIATGKAIARGGKSTGSVPGAQSQESLEK